jgi:hypothetical protein
MRTSYVAHGMQLYCDFHLPGMVPRLAGRLPTLTLALAAPGELDSVWSGPDGPPAWRGRLGDGQDLIIQSGHAGDTLFMYGSHARFLLDPRRQRLDCSAAHDSLDWQRALIGKVLPAISVMRGYEALHAAVLDSPEGVVAIAGASGAGKSTLACELLQRGWPLFADDQLTLEQACLEVRAHPGSPHISLAFAGANATCPKLGTTIGVLAGESWVATPTSPSKPRPVRMICLLERRPGRTLESKVLPANPMRLANHMLGLSTSTTRQKSRFALYCNLVESTPLVAVTGDLQSTASELADVVELALSVASSPSAAGGA